MNATTPVRVRHTVLILGDQLARDSAALDGFDPAQDRLLMVEALGENQRVWSHKARTALFLSAMRHHAAWLRAQGWPLDHHTLDATPQGGLIELIGLWLQRHGSQRLVLVEPGEWGIEQAIRALAQRLGMALELRPDRHFIVSRAEFGQWARRDKGWRMEFFYRWVRQREGILMEGTEPAGGRWNFDSDNHGSFGARGPGLLPAPVAFVPDAITREVLAAVQRHCPDNPGTLDTFDWPVTPEQARQALDDFIAHRLELFGRYQDAMWTGQPWLYHARLAAAMNLKLIDARTVVDAAVSAWHERRLPLASVEGFVRQVIGWREFIRGVYWLEMPGLQDANHYQHQRPLPRWYWTGDTGMNCARHVVQQTLAHGHAHHIQRLMVTGLFALIAEIAPREVAHWYHAVYVDAVEWVELPNVAGMALFANGGRFTSKPYAASGAYIQRMSNYCDGCRYTPGQRVGAEACPFTTLYWHFLDRHEAELAANPRTALMVKNLQRLSSAERDAIRTQAQHTLARLDGL